MGMDPQTENYNWHCKHFMMILDQTTADVQMTVSKKLCALSACVRLLLPWKAPFKALGPDGQLELALGISPPSPICVSPEP